MEPLVKFTCTVEKAKLLPHNGSSRRRNDFLDQALQLGELKKEVLFLVHFVLHDTCPLS